MTEPTNSTDDRPSVLVPIEVLEGETLPDGVPELLANAHVVLLGYHVLPEQTPPGQARIQFEDRAQRKLGQFEGSLADAGATVERRLVFTHSEQQTLDRVLAEHDCLAVLVPNACEPPEDVLVAVRGTVGVDRIATLVAGLFAGTGVSITLYHGLVEDETTEDAETFLDGIADTLFERGIDESAVELAVDDAAEAGVDRIATVAEGYDAVVMGESDPSVATFVFGMPSKQVAERFLGPVLVVQREHDVAD
ncbi:universal stress protein [Halovivax sp.]|uniref:universal stress protein n=1 Tax=Halovivax sp. TaxID=1935978 RepID=UPI0025C4E1F4|nr:universal stress protein [Halovivax sp.]